MKLDLIQGPAPAPAHDAPQHMVVLIDPRGSNPRWKPRWAAAALSPCRTFYTAGNFRLEHVKVLAWAPLPAPDAELAQDGG